MLLCILASVLIYIIIKKKKLGLMLTVAVFASSIVITFVVTYKNNYNGLLKLYMTWVWYIFIFVTFLGKRSQSGDMEGELHKITVKMNPHSSLYLKPLPRVSWSWRMINHVFEKNTFESLETLEMAKMHRRMLH